MVNPNVIEETSNKTAKLAAHILWTFVILMTPYVVIVMTRQVIRKKLTDVQKGFLEFAFRMSITLAHVNSSVNAIFLLISNVKVKALLRNYFRANRRILVMEKVTKESDNGSKNNIQTNKTEQTDLVVTDLKIN